MNMSRRAHPARLAIGLAVAFAAAACGTAAVFVDVPGLTRDAVSTTATPSAGESVVTCAGPVLAIGRQTGNAAQLSDAAAETSTASADAGASVMALSAPDVTDGAGPLVFTAAPIGGEPTDIAAAGSATVSANDLRGFAATSCERALMESWLVGGSAATGAADLVVLANPGTVAARVSIAVFGATGLTVPATGEAIVVAPGTQRVIPLAALALGEENPVLRVTAAEAPVRASLQASLTRVLEPGGVDQVGVSAVPAPQLTIPGVPVTVATGTGGDSNIPTSLRLLAPTDDATATVTIAGASGAAGEPQTVPLTAGVPLQVDLPGLAVGTYTVTVNATAPVTGAVWATSGFGAGSDFGWFVAAEAVDAPRLVAVADGPNPVLTLVGTARSVRVTDEASDGEVAEVALGTNAVAAVSVRPGAVYLIDPGEGEVRAAITYTGDTAIAGYPVSPSAAASAAFTVYPR